MVSGRVAAIDYPFDPVAADFFLDHLEEVRALASRPLKRRPVSSGITVEALKSPDGASRAKSGVA